MTHVCRSYSQTVIMCMLTHCPSCAGSSTCSLLIVCMAQPCLQVLAVRRQMMANSAPSSGAPSEAVLLQLMSDVEQLLQQAHSIAGTSAHVHVLPSSSTAAPAVTTSGVKAASLPVGAGGKAAPVAGATGAAAAKPAVASGRAVSAGQPVLPVAQLPPFGCRETLHRETLLWQKLAVVLDIPGGAVMLDVHVASWLADALLRVTYLRR